MRISRAPFRITLGGGGTDLVPGGVCIAAAIDKYMTVAVSRTFDDCYLIRYSKTERANHPIAIAHPIVRQAIIRYELEPGIEVTSTADIPAGTGLGSSGAFTVALVQALTGATEQPWLASQACALDTGRQDQHAAVYGGVNLFTFGVRTTIEPIATTVHDDLMLYYTGRQRPAVPYPSDPSAVRAQIDDASTALRTNDVRHLGQCLLDQWRTKLDRQPSDFHRTVDLAIWEAVNRGAAGGKLCGAGGGGFLLIAGDNDDVAALMKEYGWRQFPFRFDRGGVQLLT